MGDLEIYIPRLTRWKLESGNWFLDPNDVPAPIDSELDQARKKNDLRQKKDPQAPPVVIHWEKSAIELGRVSKSKPTVVHLPFTNLSQEPVSIKRSFFQAEFVRILNPDLVVKPGEKGEVQVELQTDKLDWYFGLTVQFQFWPVNELVSVLIRGVAR